MKIRVRRETFLFASILVLLAAVTFLLLSLVGGEVRTGALLAEYQAERTAFALFEAFREGAEGLEERLRRDEAILGFGVYDPLGQPLLLFGSAPPQLSAGDLPSAAPRFHREDPLRLTLIRSAGLAPMSRMMGRGPRMGGRLIWLQVSLAHLRDDGRRLAAARLLIPLAMAVVLGFFVYLYRLNLGYQRRIESHDRLVRLGEAARTLAHEIRNPLGAIRIQSAVLRRTLPASSHAELEVIDEEVQRLDLLVNRISDFLRDARGNPAPVDLDTFIRRLLSRYAAGVRFENPAGAPARVSFDPDRLRSVLENLIANARESTAREGHDGSGAPAEVDVHLQRQKGRLILSVLDRGAGLPPGKQEELFDPFFTTKTRGSGIGLALCRRFVTEAGGRIDLLPRPGGGTEARITLKELARETGGT